MQRLPLVGLVTLALSACGGQGDGASTSPSAPPPAAAAEPVLGPPVPIAGLMGDPARGRTVFAACRSCHVLAEGENRIGPSLHRIVGRRAGTVEGFTYSQANRTSGVTWTEDQLFTYLESPRRTIPGTTMSFAGIRDPQRRADLIAYLRSAS